MVVVRCVRVAGLWTGIGLVLGVLLAAAGPVAFGDQPYTVRSGSMAPVIETGDIVVTEPIGPLRAQVGDIVTFRDPSGTGRLLTHRVRAVHESGRRVDFTTQGDANTAQEHWTVPVDGRIGKILYRLPMLGYALSQTGSRTGQIGLIAVPGLVLILVFLTRIWKSNRVVTGRDDSLV
jgi:signal peptidase